MLDEIQATEGLSQKGGAQLPNNPPFVGTWHALLMAFELVHLCLWGHSGFLLQASPSCLALYGDLTENGSQKLISLNVSSPVGKSFEND